MAWPWQHIVDSTLGTPLQWLNTGNTGFPVLKTDTTTRNRIQFYYHVAFFAIEDTPRAKRYGNGKKLIWRLQRKVSFKPALFHQNVLLKWQKKRWAGMQEILSEFRNLLLSCLQIIKIPPVQLDNDFGP